MNVHFRGHDALMMFYLLPKEVVARTELTDFPRNPYIILNDPKWREVYESDYFQLVLIDTWAWLVWEHFGIRGDIEQFSGYDPFWMLAHAYTLWIKVFKAMGLTAESYFKLEPGDTLRYLTREQNYDLTNQMINYWIRNSNFCLWRDTVKKIRCHEDFDARRSNVKIDFYRKWNHTRAKVKVLDLAHTEEPSYNPFINIDNRLDVERFISGLEEKNQKIIKLLLAGYTQLEIAKILGFANHSGVCKRIKKIGAMFVKYMKH